MESKSNHALLDGWETGDEIRLRGTGSANLSGESGQPSQEREIPQGRNFSDFNRQLRDQIDPATGLRTILLTKKQLIALRLKELKSFD